jgi:hypothetical protein
MEGIALPSSPASVDQPRAGRRWPWGWGVSTPSHFLGSLPAFDEPGVLRMRVIFLATGFFSRFVFASAG